MLTAGSFAPRAFQGLVVHFGCNASGLESVGGGFGNIASGLRSFAAGGSGNTAAGLQATALGGYHNKATFPSGGNGTSGNANMSSLGGAFNIADGDYGIAWQLGRRSSDK